MIDIDKYEGLNEVIDRIINSDEIGVDDLLADSMVIKDGINELLAEVKRLREKNEEFGYQLIEAIGLLKMSVRVTKDGRRHYAERFERQTNAMLGREMIE